MTSEERFERIETLLEETNLTLRKTNATLNRLAERHEGMAETVELLIHEGRAILRKLGGKK